MINNKRHILGPRHTVIEKTASELAAVFYEAARSSGLKSQFKTPRAFARAKFITFIPKAVELLTSMLGRSDIHDLMKQEIFEALSERINDPEVSQVFPNYDVEKIFAAMPKTSPPPIIINTKNWKVTSH